MAFYSVNSTQSCRLGEALLSSWQLRPKCDAMDATLGKDNVFDGVVADRWIIDRGCGLRRGVRRLGPRAGRRSGGARLGIDLGVESVLHTGSPCGPTGRMRRVARRESRHVRLTACGGRPPSGAARAFIVPKKKAFVSVSRDVGDKTGRDARCKAGRVCTAKRYNSRFAACAGRNDRPLRPFSR